MSFLPIRPLHAPLVHSHPLTDKEGDAIKRIWRSGLYTIRFRSEAEMIGEELMLSMPSVEAEEESLGVMVRAINAGVGRIVHSADHSLYNGVLSNNHADLRTLLPEVGEAAVMVMPVGKAVQYQVWATQATLLETLSEEAVSGDHFALVLQSVVEEEACDDESGIHRGLLTTTHMDKIKIVAQMVAQACADALDLGFVAQSQLLYGLKAIAASARDLQRAHQVYEDQHALSERAGNGKNSVVQNLLARDVQHQMVRMETMVKSQLMNDGMSVGLRHTLRRAVHHLRTLKTEMEKPLQVQVVHQRREIQVPRGLDREVSSAMRPNHQKTAISKSVEKPKDIRLRHSRPIKMAAALSAVSEVNAVPRKIMKLHSEGVGQPPRTVSASRQASGDVTSRASAVATVTAKAAEKEQKPERTVRQSTGTATSSVDKMSQAEAPLAPMVTETRTVIPALRASGGVTSAAFVIADTPIQVSTYNAVPPLIVHDGEKKISTQGGRDGELVSSLGGNQKGEVNHYLSQPNQNNGCMPRDVVGGDDSRNLPNAQTETVQLKTMQPESAFSPATILDVLGNHRQNHHSMGDESNRQRMAVSSSNTLVDDPKDRGGQDIKPDSRQGIDHIPASGRRGREFPYSRGFTPFRERRVTSSPKVDQVQILQQPVSRGGEGGRQDRPKIVDGGKQSAPKIEQQVRLAAREVGCPLSGGAVCLCSTKKAEATAEAQKNSPTTTVASITGDALGQALAGRGRRRSSPVPH